MRRWLGEPFVHFVAIGVLLFATRGWWEDRISGEDNTIYVSAASLDRIKSLWASEAMRLPSDEDVDAIIADYAQEEALVREARKLGLDRGDTVVRRRLAQKMQSLLFDRARIAEPDEAELAAWYEDNADRFATPELRSFVHVFFSPESRGANVEAEAAAARGELGSGGDWRGAGDPFIQKREYADLSEREATRIFGRDFAERLFALEPGTWSRPIGSAFGVHLVRVEAVSPPKKAGFSEIRSTVREAYMEAERRKANRAALDDLMAGYDIEVEK